MLVPNVGQPLLEDVRPARCHCGSCDALFTVVIGLGVAMLAAKASYTTSWGGQDKIAQQLGMNLASHMAVAPPRLQSPRGWVGSGVAGTRNHNGVRALKSQQLEDVEAISPDLLPLLLIPDSIEDSKENFWQRDFPANFEPGEEARQKNKSIEALGPRTGMPMPTRMPSLYDGPYGRQRPNWKRPQALINVNSSSITQGVAAGPQTSSKQRTSSPGLSASLLRASGQLLQIAGMTMLQGGAQFLAQKPKARLLALCKGVQPNGIGATVGQRQQIKSMVAELSSFNPTQKPAFAFEKQKGLWRMVYTDWPSQQGQYGPFTGEVFQYVEPNIEGGIIGRMLKIHSSIKLDSELMANQAVFDENTWRINFAKLTTNVAGVVLPRQYFGLYDEVWLWRYLYLDEDLRVWRAFKLGDLKPGNDQDYLFVTVRD